MKMFPTPVEPRRLMLGAPRATEASVPVSIRLYRRETVRSVYAQGLKDGALQLHLYLAAREKAVDSMY
jgi:hypothetical protein